MRKEKIFEIFQKVKKFVENREKSETGGKCIMASEGMDAPGLKTVLFANPSTDAVREHC